MQAILRCTRGSSPFPSNSISSHFLPSRLPCLPLSLLPFSSLYPSPSFRSRSLLFQLESLGEPCKLPSGAKSILVHFSIR